MESTDKLRKYSHLDDDKWALETGEVVYLLESEPNDPNAINWGEQWRKIADEIEREVAERYMELPVDAEGVPIHVGDKLHGVYETFEVCAVNEHYAYWEYGRHWDKACECRHVELRTIEDVLHEFELDAHDAHTPDAYSELLSKYADELRSMGVSE